METSVQARTTRRCDKLTRAQVCAIFKAGAQRRRGKHSDLTAKVATQYGTSPNVVYNIWNLCNWADTTRALWTDADHAQWRATDGNNLTADQVTTIFQARPPKGQYDVRVAKLMMEYDITRKCVRDIWKLRTWSDTTRCLWTAADHAYWCRDNGQAASDIPITLSVRTKIVVPVVSLRTLRREEATGMVIREV